MPLRGNSRRRGVFFYPQIAPPGSFLSADCAGGEFFYPQISQIHADYGGLSCRCAAIHAAGFFAD
ncbi:MAG: hypothetical protein ACOX9E_12270 [Lentisphaeria bacterium]